jgi:hypothetical protein
MAWLLPVWPPLEGLVRPGRPPLPLARIWLARRIPRLVAVRLLWRIQRPRLLSARLLLAIRIP